MASNDKTIGPATKTSPLETKLISNKGPTDAEITLKENKHICLLYTSDAADE